MFFIAISVHNSALNLSSLILTAQRFSLLEGLVLVWDKTASGTVRSNTENELHSLSAPCFGMGRDCLWDSEEQHREWTAQLICYLLLHGTRLPLGWQGATHMIDCTAYLLLDSMWDKPAPGTARSSKLFILATNLLLNSVWDKTASGTARSKVKENCGSLWQSGSGRSYKPLWEPRGAILDSIKNTIFDIDI